MAWEKRGKGHRHAKPGPDKEIESVSLPSRKVTTGLEGRVGNEATPGHRSSWWRCAPWLQEDKQSWRISSSGLRFTPSCGSSPPCLCCGYF
ncbi:hypothetical protein HaLaN_17480 [Haematococcus lacustris]|uniref:Uncharacterized protein n=1 Tax=Haematococcus lacustris TaxID=44745 RepID=A0A699ZE16_HAELA|nr:hypothetical protein HaLaN_17480 [Haematococcus lacustris]